MRLPTTVLTMRASDTVSPSAPSTVLAPVNITTAVKAATRAAWAKVGLFRKKDETATCDLLGINFCFEAVGGGGHRFATVVRRRVFVVKSDVFAGGRGGGGED